MSAAADPYIIVALRTSPGGVRQATATQVATEWDAHDLATMLVHLGHRTFFVNPDGDDDEPTIEEYRHPADEDKASTSHTIKVSWADSALERALADLICAREGETTPCAESVMVAIDAIRTCMGEDA